MNRNKACYLIACVIFVNIFIGVLCWVKRNALDKQQSSFKLPVTNILGEEVTLELIQSAPCLILFFNTQCDLCLTEIKLVKEHVKELSNLYTIFFISFEPPQSLYSFFFEQGIDFGNKRIHAIADEKLTLLDYYQIKGYPSFIVFDNNQEIKSRGSVIDQNIITALLKQ